jgi:hypothetical protein
LTQSVGLPVTVIRGECLGEDLHLLVGEVLADTAVDVVERPSFGDGEPAEVPGTQVPAVRVTLSIEGAHRRHPGTVVVTQGRHRRTSTAGS